MLTISVGLIFIAALTFARKMPDTGQVEEFQYVEPGQATCLALIPECGHCPGEIIDKKCYMTKNAE